jgi:hypothetical protein
LVQSAIQGWTAAKEDILKALPGGSRLLDIQQCQPPQDLAMTLKLQMPPTGESLGLQQTIQTNLDCGLLGWHYLYGNCSTTILVETTDLSVSHYHGDHQGD